MNKIDIVIAWVDGSDPEWQEVRAEALPDRKFTISQFRDWGLLKYLFRGIETNASWVNNVYFITWGHLPNFLNVNHPKLKIIKHSDYIPSEYLPTFSANPIEMNFHRIEGLSEQFIYFNDDMYLINKTEPEDFFKDGKARDSAVLNPIAPANYNTISGIMLNDISIINQHFSIREVIKKNPSKWFNLKYGSLNLLNLMFLPWKNAVGLYQQHLPSSLFKSAYEEVWEKEHDILDATSKNKVRDVKRDVNQWLVKEWQVMQGRFIPRSKKFGKYLMIKSFKDVEKAKHVILSSNVKTVCINDHVSEDMDEIMESLVKVFEEKFPNKSTFEK